MDCSNEDSTVQWRQESHDCDLSNTIITVSDMQMSHAHIHKPQFYFI